MSLDAITLSLFQDKFNRCEDKIDSFEKDYIKPSAMRIELTSTTTGFQKSYAFYQGNTKIGIIDIPYEEEIDENTINQLFVETLGGG